MGSERVKQGEKISKWIAAFLFSIILGFHGADSALSIPRNDQIVIYYFHKTIRCPSCMLLEKMTRIAVESEFQQELEKGRIRIAAINLEEDGNKHFIHDYNLDFQSVVISEIDNGEEKRWKNLDQVWNLLHDEGQLLAYIQKEISGYLKN